MSCFHLQTGLMYWPFMQVSLNRHFNCFVGIYFCLVVFVVNLKKEVTLLFNICKYHCKDEKVESKSTVFLNAGDKSDQMSHMLMSLVSSGNDKIHCPIIVMTMNLSALTRHLAASSQFLNFVLMPLYMRTAFMGCCAFLWATFLCFSRQNGDGTAAVALAFVMDPRKTLEEMREARLARKRQKAQREN